MKISVNARNKSYVTKKKTAVPLGMGIGFAFLCLSCAVPEGGAAEASQSKLKIEALFVTDYISEADWKGTPPPDTRISVYRVNIVGPDEQPQAEVVEIVFDAYEYWRSALSVDPKVANYQNAADFYNLSLGVRGLEDYLEYNIAVFELLKSRQDEGYFGNGMCFIFADGRSEPFCMVDLNPERLYRPGFVTRNDVLYISIFSKDSPCELLVFPANNPSLIRVTNDYVNFYAGPTLWTEGESLFFYQIPPLSSSLEFSKEERAQYFKENTVQISLKPSKSFPPYLKDWVLVANKEDCLVLREIPPSESRPIIGPLAKEGFRALITIMKEKNEEGVNPVVWEEEPYSAPKKELALEHKIASTPEYSLWRTESGAVCKVENGQRSTVALDLEQDEQLFLVKNKAFIKKQQAHDFAELQICDTVTLFNSTKSEREALSTTLKIDNEKLREDINGLRLIMPVASKN